MIKALVTCDKCHRIVAKVTDTRLGRPGETVLVNEAKLELRKGCDPHAVCKCGAKINLKEEEEE